MSAPVRFADWDTLHAALPEVVATMRRYLDQLTCLLRPGSVRNTDQVLRSLAMFLAERTPSVTSVKDVDRRCVEDYIRWLAARPGKHTPRATPATLAHRLGTLRMFFVRIAEWDWPDAPNRLPIIPGDLPKQDHPLPKALDDAAAAKLLRAAHDQRRMLVDAKDILTVIPRKGARSRQGAAANETAVDQTAVDQTAVEQAPVDQAAVEEDEPETT